MKNIHFITNYETSKETTNGMKKYTNNENNFDNITIDYDKPADNYIIMNYPHTNAKYESNKTILFYNEPLQTRNRWKNWEKKETFMYNSKEKNLTGWSLNMNYNELLTKPLLKTRDKYISTITSDLSTFAGHKLRLNFLKYLDNINDNYNNIIPHIYGKTTKTNSPLLRLNNYKGKVRYKDIGLVSYKYHFACENSCEKNYFTEKITDAILSESLCFYYGCPNIKSYIPEESFVWLDITRPLKSLMIIQKAINDDLYSKRIKKIKEAKKKILTELSIMPTISKILNQN